MAQKYTEVSDLSEITLDRLNEELFSPELDFDQKAEFTDLRKRLEAIPIANDTMTTDELRQIVVDYLRLSVSFQWVCDRYMAFNKDKPAQTFYKGKLYGGIPYINTASGNLYRILEYYDDETGVLNTEYFSQNPLYFGTACSGTSSTALSRVVNSAELSWTSRMNMANGHIPVGNFQYDYNKHTIWTKQPDGKRFHHYNTKKVCRANGEQVMYDAYARGKKADCYSSNGHVRLAGDEAVVVRDENGLIDGEKSYIELIEQGLYTTGADRARKTSDGTAYHVRGNDGRGGKVFTFKELFEAGYLVHTYREFLGLKKVDKSKVEILPPKDGEAFVETETILDDNVVSNYPISDLFFTLKDAKGEAVYSKIYRLHPHYCRTVSMERALPKEEILKLEEEKGPLTLELLAQISTGEKPTVYCGPIQKEKKPEAEETAEEKKA